MKNLLLLPPILGSNMVLGGAAGLYRVFGLAAKTKDIFLMPFCGIAVGFINGLKFEAVSVITDYLKPGDNTAIKVGVNLCIDAVFGSLAYAAADNIALGGGLFATLSVMDATNFVIESYMDNPDCIELANMQIIE